MKTTFILFLFLGLATPLSAQFLMRSETIKDKIGSNEKKTVINLDTMPQILFLKVVFGHWHENETIDAFDIGDGYIWQWVDETYKPIRLNSYVAGLNRLAKQNWVFQLPIRAIPTSEPYIDEHIDFLFKRREK